MASKHTSVVCLFFARSMHVFDILTGSFFAPETEN
jgi:hypothetical protein